MSVDLENTQKVVQSYSFKPWNFTAIFLYLSENYFLEAFNY